MLVATIVAVVVSAAGCVVEHLRAELAVAFVEEVQQAADLQFVGAGELLLASVKVHLALPRRT